MNEIVTEGRTVHFVLPNNQEHRPAVVVNAWGNGGGELKKVNMIVFLDGTNDSVADREGNTYWATSVPYSETKEPGTWHWPERE